MTFRCRLIKGALWMMDAPGRIAEWFDDLDFVIQTLIALPSMLSAIFYVCLIGGTCADTGHFWSSVWTVTKGYMIGFLVLLGIIALVVTLVYAYRGIRALWDRTRRWLETMARDCGCES